MQTVRFLRRVAIAALAILASARLCDADVLLGDAPTAPKDVSGLPTGPMSKDVTGGFTVNTESREEVRSFYNAVYRSSDGVPMNTTADVSTCFAGTNGTLFQEAALRRINWFRAMAGVPAAVTFNAGESARCQDAAVMMSANNTLDHYPPPGWLCFTANGANAASNSNLAIGNAGADAITAYIWDFGANNAVVGHRRWLLYPQTQVMGTGDVPDQGNFSAANATWVFDGNYGGPRPATRKPYVAWPPAGYVPYQVVYPQWSFAVSNVNLSGATVSMRSNGVVVGLSMQPYQTGVGESTIVWVPMGLDYTSEGTRFPFNGSNTVYTVTVTNIPFGLSRTGYTYSVTLFDPAVPGADFLPPTISGPSQPVVGRNNAYTFTAVSNATSYGWRVTQPSPFNFSDGAESGLGNFTVNTSAGYAVEDSSVSASGAFSFRLAHADPPTSQMLTLNQTFVPKTNGTLALKSRLGFAADGETARVQISTDGGVGWQDIFSQAGNNSGLPVENTFVTRSFPLGAFADKTIQLRFNYTYTSGLNYYPVQPGTVGWYLDDIAITSAEVWTLVSTNATTTTNFTFNPSQPANYNLNVRALIFTEFPLEWGPVKNVAATTGAPPVMVLSRPVVAGGQVQLDFAVTSGASATFKLLQADQVSGPWTTNGSATLTTNVPGSSYRFTTTVGPAVRFYRVQAP
jgi:hypothetical protein